MIKSVSAKELNKQLSQEQNYLILDVREEYEFMHGHIPNALLIPMRDLAVRWREIEPYKEQVIVVYCNAGIRSSFACKLLDKHNFKQIWYLADGLNSWRLLHEIVS